MYDWMIYVLHQRVHKRKLSLKQLYQIMAILGVDTSNE